MRKEAKISAAILTASNDAEADILPAQYSEIFGSHYQTHQKLKCFAIVVETHICETEPFDIVWTVPNFVYPVSSCV